MTGAMQFVVHEAAVQMKCSFYIFIYMYLYRYLWINSIYIYGYIHIFNIYLDDGGDAVRGARGGGADQVLLGQLVVVDAHHHIENLDTLIRGGVALEKGALAIEECVFCYGGVPESLHQR